MKAWPKHPLIYEINTWVWLQELSRKQGRPVTLGTVSSAEWDALSSLGADAVWFMGVWERSRAGIAIANRNAMLLEAFRWALPDFKLEDNVGSPYCVRRYEVDAHLGGRDGLAAARQELAGRNLRLILDFVPNHVAPDHPWAGTHPEYFIQGSAEDARNDPASFLEVEGTVFACGRDPYFPAWPDVLQLNAFHPGLRQAAADTVSSIADQCDGIRCDMAMLMLNSVFARTWGSRAGTPPATDYWKELIPQVRSRHPGFRFIAEAYWDLEWELQQHGFDFCYDKRLYDRMDHDTAENVRLHLCADPAYQHRLVRFIENHDEPRASAVFRGGKDRAAAVAILTLTGAKLLHEGQIEGRNVRLPVFLGRRPSEPADPDLARFYGKLLKAVGRDLFRNGEWRLCDRFGWPDNQSFLNLLAWCWTNRDERALVVINFGPARAQAQVRIPWSELRGKSLRLIDGVHDVSYDRNGGDMLDNGLFVDLKPWEYHLFDVREA